MEPATLDEPRIRGALERVLSSATFTRHERVSKLLRFLVERHLDGRDDELKETSIGVEVFGRKPDYDPKLDSTVRTEAVRLRARLAKYYSAEGAEDPVVIEVPRGGYIPRCSPRAIPVVQPTSASPALPPSSAVRWKPLRVAVGLTASMAIAIAAGAYWLHANAPVQLAVFPLVNVSGSPTNEPFTDGLTDEIIRQASNIAGVIVRSRTTSFALKGRALSANEVATQLDVEYLIEGSVVRSGPQIRINARLVRSRDDVAIWTGSFERHMRDELAMQQEIARGVVNAVQLKLGRGTRRYDSEAYDLYLRAGTAATLRFQGDDEIVGLLEQAVGKDPSMAPAHAGLAIAYAFRSFQSPNDPHRAETLAKMRAAAERAAALDLSLPEAHAALGAAYANAAQWKNAERSFRHAIDLDPSLGATRYAFARFVLWPLGRMDEAVHEALTGAGNAPLSPIATEELADVLLSAGHYDQAARYCEQLPAEMGFSRECLGRTRVAQGRASEAIDLLASSATNNWGYLAYAYAKAGLPDKALALAADAQRRYPRRRGPFQSALLFAGLGDRDKAIEQLQRMASVGPVRIGFTLNSPEFAFLNDDLRVKALRHQVGLPE